VLVPGAGRDGNMARGIGQRVDSSVIPSVTFLLDFVDQLQSTRCDRSVRGGNRGWLLRLLRRPHARRVHDRWPLATSLRPKSTLDNSYYVVFPANTRIFSALKALVALSLLLLIAMCTLSTPHVVDAGELFRRSRTWRGSRPSRRPPPRSAPRLPAGALARRLIPPSGVVGLWAAGKTCRER
jgi:hypothetical protein